jgi:hypothetical protein
MHEEVGGNGTTAYVVKRLSHELRVAHPAGLWVRDDTRQLDYTQFEPWVVF